MSAYRDEDELYDLYLDPAVTPAEEVTRPALRAEDGLPFERLGEFRLLRRIGRENTVLAWANGDEIRVVALAADCTRKIDATFSPPEGMDRVNHLAWSGTNGLVGTGSLGDDGQWFVADDWTDAFGLDECTRFAE